MKLSFRVYLCCLIVFLFTLQPALAAYDARSGTSDPGSKIETKHGPELSGQYQLASSVQSDDFNTCTLNTDLWTWVDPAGDGTYSIASDADDAWLSISVPAGEKHTLSSSNTDAPRMMQAANDTDFEVEVKFNSGVSSRYQIQGIIVEGEPDVRLLRFDFHGDGSNTFIYASSFITPTLQDQVYQAITTTTVAPLYMRVNRAGNLWTQSYSYDGQSWTSTDTFTEAITVTAVGVFAGNSFMNEGESAPAHTAVVDYFFNTASPVDPEDGKNTLATHGVGSGSVQRQPNRSAYPCGQTVTLTAVPNPGWSFDSWSGDLIGNTNPDTLTMTAAQVVTATFTQDHYLLTIDTEGNGTVARQPDNPNYIFGDQVRLTATAAPGWSFDGWSGALISSTNPATLTMTADSVVTATFTMDQRRVFLPIIQN